MGILSKIDKDSYRIVKAKPCRLNYVIKYSIITSSKFILHNVRSLHSELSALFTLLPHVLWFTSCNSCSVLFTVTCSTLIKMSDCILKCVGVEGFFVYISLNKTWTNGLISTATTHYIMHGDAWEYLSAIPVLYYVIDGFAIRFSNKGVPSGLLSPFLGCCGLLLCFLRSWCHPEGSFPVFAAQWVSGSPSLDKTSACRSCRTTHTTNLEQGRLQDLEDWWGKGQIIWNEVNRTERSLPYESAFSEVFISHHASKITHQIKSQPYAASTLNMACCPSFWASWRGVSPSWLGKVNNLWPLGWWIKKRERWAKPKRTARWRRVSLGWSSAARERDKEWRGNDVQA